MYTSRVVRSNAVSLRKSPTQTPARLAANRRNAQKSTGPRTARGKAQSRLNALHNRSNSPTFHKLIWTIVEAPPGKSEEATRALLTPEQARHPLYAGVIEITRQAEIGVAEVARELARTRLTQVEIDNPRLRRSKA